MENETRRRRKQQTRATRPPATVHDIPDHLLHSVINRLRCCHVSLIRAAAVCKRWRRVAPSRPKDYSDWYRDRHELSTCIGQYYHAADPSFSRRRSHALFVPDVSRNINARHFSLDFLPVGPGGRAWELVDGSGSLLLLAVQRRDFFPDLVVCEPVSRRYVRIHPIPEMKYSRCLGAFLGYRPHDTIAMSRFTVTCVLCDHAAGMEDGVSVVTARVYIHRDPPDSPTSRLQMPNGWDVSSKAATSRGIHLRGAETAQYFAGRTWLSTFWGVEDGTVFALEMDSCKFSHFRLPEHVRESHHRSTFRFVEDEPRHRVVLVSLFGDELRVFVKREHNDGSVQWVHEKSLRLPEATRGLPGHKECHFGRTAKVVTAGKGYVVLTPAEETWMFSVELRTMMVEREHIRNRVVGEVYPYELQTRPKLNACRVQCKRGRIKVCRDYCKCK